MVSSWILGSNEFYDGERVTSTASASGWYLEVGEDEWPVVLWVHVVSDRRPGGDLGRVVGLVNDKGQLRPGDKITGGRGYVYRQR